MFAFNEEIFMTSTIAEQLPVEHQQFIYQYFKEHQDIMTDYLQVFDFYVQDGKQFLLQSQEQPDRKTSVEVLLEKEKPITRTIWMMNQGEDGSIILFPSDY